MGANSNISWTDHTFNPWRGCAKVSAGCKNCYAETLSRRNPALMGVWGDEGTRVLASESMWAQPPRWNALAMKEGFRRRVFCASLADVFEAPKALNNALVVETGRRRLWKLINTTPWLDWLLLTKRPDNVPSMVPAWWYGHPEFGRSVVAGKTVYDGSGWPSNVWLGTSAEDQPTFDERSAYLVETPARVRFLSLEPLLGPIDMTATGEASMDPSVLPSRTQDGACSRCGCWWSDDDDRSPRHSRGHTCPPGFEEQNIDWVIVGGESGGKRRSMDLMWAESLREQCDAAGVSFFFKQDSALKPGQRGRASDALWACKEFPQCSV